PLLACEVDPIATPNTGVVVVSAVVGGWSTGGVSTGVASRLTGAASRGRGRSWTTLTGGGGGGGSGGFGGSGSGTGAGGSTTRTVTIWRSGVAGRAGSASSARPSARC